MATIARQRVAAAGLNPSFVGAAATDKCPFGDSTFLVVKNAHGSINDTVTINDPSSKSPVGAATFNPDLVIVVPFGGERWIGPLGRRFRDPTDGLVHIAHSSIASVTEACVMV